jgi:hypothetical protein
MSDASHRQQYKINAMHGHDLGLWVIEGSGLSLSPVLFMQAINPAAEPRPLLVKWKADTEPPRAFQKQGALRLIYSDCGRLPAWPYYVHLFAPQAPVEQALEDSSNLRDWAWSVPISGIVAIFNRQYDHAPSTFSLERLLKRAPQPRSPLAWAEAQQIPIVIAALGYADDPTSYEEFRELYRLPPEITVVPGPALANERKPDSSMFSMVFERQNVVFDKDFAGVVLGKLLKQIERER